MPRPVVGITTYRTQARWGVWDLPAALTPWAYVEAVAAAGGAPLLLPPVPEGAEAVLARLDAVVLCGGPDLSPSLYGAATATESGPFDEVRDGCELELARAAVARDLPVLGICRGMQMLNVALGGTLQQHLETTATHRAAPGRFALHRVSTSPGSRLAGIIGPAATVCSYHHQGLGSVGDGLLTTVVADDGTIEAFEHPGRGFVVGVLWHPEMGDDGSLFEALVAAARAPAGGRRAGAASSVSVDLNARS